MKNQSLNRIAGLLAMLVALLGMTACQHDEQTAPEGSPQQPPLSSLAMNIDAFPQQNPATQTLDTVSQGITTSATATYANFTYSVLNVAVWSTLLKIGLAVPVAAFKESFRHPPDLRSDNTWVWSYSVTVDGIIHTAELHAVVMETSIQWDMYVTKPGHYLDFNWFSGESALDRSNGYWLIRENPDNPNPLLNIDWTYDPQTVTGQVTYTNVRPGDIDNGAYITYGNNAPAPYDAFFDIYNKANNELVEIEWNLLRHDGRVKNPVHFNDADWHYWDILLRDAPAPQ